MPLGEAAADLGTGIARLGHEVHGAQQNRALRGISVDQRLRAVGVENPVVLLIGRVEVVGDRLPRRRDGPVTYGFGYRGVSEGSMYSTTPTLVFAASSSAACCC